MQIQEENDCLLGRTHKGGKVRERSTPGLIFPLWSLTLTFPQGIIHVGNEVRLLFICLFWTVKPLVFIIFVSVVICIFIVPVPHPFVFWCPSLKSHDLWQVCMMFPKFCRPEKTPDQLHLPFPLFNHLLVKEEPVLPLRQL